jgi:hypothetical protein
VVVKKSTVIKEVAEVSLNVKKGFFARIFKGKKSKGGWVYHKTNPGLKQNREQSKLFSRFRTKNKRYRDGVLANQNRKRASSRGGNFSKKKR